MFIEKQIVKGVGSTIGTKHSVPSEPRFLLWPTFSHGRVALVCIFSINILLLWGRVCSIAQRCQRHRMFIEKPMLEF